MKVEISDGHCVTYLSQEGEYYGGSCPFEHTKSNTSIGLYSELSFHPEKVNHTLCSSYNRKGLLCGKCIDEHGPAVYSYGLKCALFLFLELFPGTLFFFFVVVFRLSVTSGPLLGYVFFCQVFTFYQVEQFHIYDYIKIHSI